MRFHIFDSFDADIFGCIFVVGQQFLDVMSSIVARKIFEVQLEVMIEESLFRVEKKEERYNIKRERLCENSWWLNQPKPAENSLDKLSKCKNS